MLVECIFYNGFCIRNIIDHINDYNIDGMLKFTSEGVFYSQANPCNTIINFIELYPKKNIFDYFFKAKTPIYFPFKIHKMKEIVKFCGKNHTIKMSIYEEYCCMQITLIDNGNVEYQVDLSSLEKGEFTPKIIYIPKYNNRVKCTESASKLNVNCNLFVDNKCEAVVLSCYSDGIAMESQTEGTKNNYYCVIGKCTTTSVIDINGSNFSVKEYPILKIWDNAGNIKVLSKLSNITKNPIKFYFEKDKPIKCLIELSFGNYYIYLAGKMDE